MVMQYQLADHSADLTMPGQLGLLGLITIGFNVECTEAAVRKNLLREPARPRTPRTSQTSNSANVIDLSILFTYLTTMIVLRSREILLFTRPSYYPV